MHSTSNQQPGTTDHSATPPRSRRLTSLYDLKPAFGRLLTPLVDALARIGVTPNGLTVLALLMSAAAGGLAFLWPESAWPWWVVALCLPLRMALNAMDGLLARRHQLITPQGGVLNELCDVLSDACLYLPFMMLAPNAATALFGLLLLSTLGEFVGVLAAQAGGERRYDGPFGKSDRALAFGLLAALVGSGLDVSGWLNEIWVVLMVLAAVTLLNRFAHAMQGPTARANGGDA